MDNMVGGGAGDIMEVRMGNISRVMDCGILLHNRITMAQSIPTAAVEEVTVEVLAAEGPGDRLHRIRSTPLVQVYLMEMVGERTVRRFRLHLGKDSRDKSVIVTVIDTNTLHHVLAIGSNF